MQSEKYRSAYRRDYARLIHSSAFRRLQGKTQLFRGLESDFFRNRLTHSLEVAQIAKSIAIRLNNTNPYFKANPIDTDLIETVSLAHDLGHPPFGHNGEQALDDCMKDFGGFEGNAQTLRILARSEKKKIKNFPEILPPGITQSGKDYRLGLNLTFRTLAGILKYDQKIPLTRRSKESTLIKGYYASEAEFVKEIKKHVLRGRKVSMPFKTIECSIMDLSDDIAYSIYDLEDSFKAGFTSPLEMLAINDELASRVATKVSDAVSGFKKTAVIRVLNSIFENDFQAIPPGSITSTSQKNWGPMIASQYFATSKKYASNAYLRCAFTSRMVNEFIQGVEVKINGKYPMLSKVFLPTPLLEKVEVLKHYTFEKLIMSPMLKVVEHRGYDVVKDIFTALTSDKGHLLLPDDFQEVYGRMPTRAQKQRVVCDFIAGMTDRYAVEFYGRLRSENAQTMFKPL